MNQFIIDTNVILRFLLNDFPQQAKKAENYLKQAKAKKIEIIVISEVVFETIYVLQKYYGVPRKDCIKTILGFIGTPYLTILPDREILNNTLNSYSKHKNIDLIDTFIYSLAEKRNYNILSFDKDFQRLEKTPDSEKDTRKTNSSN